GLPAGGSNSPVAMRIVNSFVRSVSMTPTERTPALIAASTLGSVAESPVHSIWVPARSAYARPPAAAGIVTLGSLFFVQVFWPLTTEEVQPGADQLWLSQAVSIASQS